MLTRSQLDQYVTQIVDTHAAIPTTEASVPQVPPVMVEQPPQQAPQQNQAILPREPEEPAVTERARHSSKARVEYRDQDGNVLDEEFVAALKKEGKVQFETRHETKTRLENGHIVDMVDGQLAPPHPDVEGQNPETVGRQPPVPAEDRPASVVGRGSSHEQQNSPDPKPASEVNEATQS